jgi:hypothetical protein
MLFKEEKAMMPAESFFEKAAYSPDFFFIFAAVFRYIIHGATLL